MKLFGKHAQSVAERIVEAFKHPESLPKALAPIFIHRNDDIPMRKWSRHNQLLAALCGTTDARGIKQWNAVGRKVKKGSGAIWILAPCMRKVIEKDDLGQESERSILYGFRSVPVFALEDTEGDPLPDRDDNYDAWVRQLPLAEVAEAWGIKVGTFSHNGADPLGYYCFAQSGGQAIR